MSEQKKGLTKPLINNVGGMIDQDAPSADQLLQGKDDPNWENTNVREDNNVIHNATDDGFMHSGAERMAQPGMAPSDRTPGGGPSYGDGESHE